MTIGMESLLPLLFWIPVISVFLNFLLTIFLVIAVQRGKLKSKEQQTIENEMINVIKQAENKSVSIIEVATGKARDIVLQAHGTKKLLDDKLDKLVDDTADIAQNELDKEKAVILAKFNEGYGQIIQQFTSETQMLMANLQHDSREMRRTFAEQLQKEALEILKAMKTNIEVQIKSVEKEIKDYRDKTFGDIDAHADNIVKQIVSDYFGNKLSKDNHKKILFNAFEKFKLRHTKKK